MFVWLTVACLLLATAGKVFYYLCQHRFSDTVLHLIG